MNDENLEAAKLLRALSRALNNGDISIAFMDAAKAVVADGIEQDNFCLYMRCRIEQEYPMEDYMDQAEKDLDEARKPYSEDPGSKVGETPAYPH